MTTAGSDATEYGLKQLLRADHNFRFKPDQPQASEALDDADDENIAALEKQGHELVHQKATELADVCMKLLATQ